MINRKINRTIVDSIRELNKDYPRNHIEINRIMANNFLNGSNGFPYDHVQAQKHLLRIIIAKQIEIETESRQDAKMLLMNNLVKTKEYNDLKTIEIEGWIRMQHPEFYVNSTNTFDYSAFDRPKFEVALLEIEDYFGKTSSLEEILLSKTPPSLYYLSEHEVLKHSTLFAPQLVLLPNDIRDELQNPNVSLGRLCPNSNNGK